MEKRREHRVHRFMQVKVKVDVGDIPGSSVDVSPTGMCVRLHNRKPIPPRSLVHLDVKDHGKQYDFDAVVRWFRHDPVGKTRHVGLCFSKTPLRFCEEVLLVSMGSEDHPLQSFFPSRDAFIQEYTENIQYGGLFLKSDAQPDIYSKVHIALVVGEETSPFNLKAEVVAHIGDGIGLKLEDEVGCRRKIEAWLNQASIGA